MSDSKSDYNEDMELLVREKELLVARENALYEARGVPEGLPLPVVGVDPEVQTMLREHQEHEARWSAMLDWYNQFDDPHAVARPEDCNWLPPSA